MKKFSIRTSRLLAGAAVAAALFAACTADTEDEPVAAVPLRFAVSMPESWNTPDAARSTADKALPTRADFTGNSFGVFAYVKGSTSEESPILYMNNVEVIKHMAGDDIYYAPKENYYLRGGMETIFFAYHPYKEEFGSLKQISCDVVNDNTDWLTAVASSTTEKVEGGIALAFSHALSKVTFTVSETETSYSTFTLSSIATTGTLEPTFTDSNPKGSWSISTSKGTKFSGTLDGEYFMIPQSVENQTIGLTGTDKTRTLTGTWAANTQYTYTLSTTSGS